MLKTLEADGKQWVPLGTASRMLDVNEATVRRWADRGLVRSFRTPGGHRRFRLEDLRSLMEEASPARDGSGERRMADAALLHIRRRLRSRSAAQQAWHERIPEQFRGRMRLFGYRLITLAADYLGGRGHKPELLASARLVGGEYGAETARLGLSMEEATQAFIFFRNSLVEGLQETKAYETTQDAVFKKWQQVNAVTDEVLTGIVRAYQEARVSMAVDQKG